MNDGNPSKINGFINFEKMTMMAKSVQEITKLGSYEFPYEKKPEILNYLDKPNIEFDLEKLKAQAAILENQ
jgi:hypothetical protein